MSKSETAMILVLIAIILIACVSLVPLDALARIPDALGKVIAIYAEAWR